MAVVILKNIALLRYTTFKIGGLAKYFVVAKNISDVKQAIKWAKDKKIKHCIVGGGSNVLFTNKGFDGLVIRIQNIDYEIKNTNIIVGAGMNLGQLVGFSVKNSLTGIEWASGIPGTVGGAVRGNAGAFGHSLSEVIKSVKILDEKLQVKNYKLQDLDFGYRDSIFKKPNNKDIIISVNIELDKGDKEESLSLIKKYIKTKKESQPLEYPSAGCVFKNCQAESFGRNFTEKYPELKEFCKKGIVPTGWLIEKCGLKGKTVGGAAVSAKHASFINNTGNASSDDVLKLIKIVEREVKKKFNVKLEKEIEII